MLPGERVSGINYTQWAIKLYIPFDLAKQLLGLYPKEIKDSRKEPTRTKIVAALFVVAKKWKPKGCPSIGEWLNKLWYMIVMEYYCTLRNEEQDDFRKSWEDLHKLMQSEISRTRSTLYTVTEILYDGQL